MKKRNRDVDSEDDDSSDDYGDESDEEEEESELEDDNGEQEEDEVQEVSQSKQVDDEIAARYPEFREVLDLIEQLRQKHPQTDMDGERNIWILKPAASSRGRDIVLHKNLA